MGTLHEIKQHLSMYLARAMFNGFILCAINGKAWLSLKEARHEEVMEHHEHK